MMNNILETRARKEGLYNITLEIPEKNYFDIYDGVYEKDAEDILKQYMVYRGDDGRPSDISIEHNKNSHIINIYANLHYEGNDHTQQQLTPSIPYLND